MLQYLSQWNGIYLLRGYNGMEWRKLKVNKVNTMLQYSEQWNGMEKIESGLTCRTGWKNTVAKLRHRCSDRTGVVGPWARGNQFYSSKTNCEFWVWVTQKLTGFSQRLQKQGRRWKTMPLTPWLYSSLKSSQKSGRSESKSYIRRSTLPVCHTEIKSW